MPGHLQILGMYPEYLPRLINTRAFYITILDEVSLNNQWELDNSYFDQINMMENVFSTLKMV